MSFRELSFFIFLSLSSAHPLHQDFSKEKNAKKSRRCILKNGRRSENCLGIRFNELMKPAKTHNPKTFKT